MSFKITSNVAENKYKISVEMKSIDNVDKLLQELDFISRTISKYAEIHKELTDIKVNNDNSTFNIQYDKDFIEEDIKQTLDSFINDENKLPTVYYKFKCPSCKQSLMFFDNDNNIIISTHNNYFKPSIIYVNKNKNIDFCENLGSPEVILSMARQLANHYGSELAQVSLMKTDSVECIECPMCGNLNNTLNDWIDEGLNTHDNNCVICGANASIIVNNNHTYINCEKNEDHNIIIGD